MGLGPPRGWAAAVLAAVLVLAVAGVSLGVDWLVSARSRTRTLSVDAPVTALQLDLSSGSAEIVGGATGGVIVQRTDDYAFGRAAHERRSLAGGVLRIASACPHIVLGSCSASYRLTVPDDVAVHVATTSGDVHVAGFRGTAAIRTSSGNITVDAYCGFGLSAVSRSGTIGVIAACAPERLDLRSGTGDVRAVVPVGRYRILAASAGRRHISGVVPSAQASFTISVRSATGDVSVAGGL